MISVPDFLFFFFFNDTATTEIYTLSLHDALPICRNRRARGAVRARCLSAAIALSFQTGTEPSCKNPGSSTMVPSRRSEEHTSELQSQSNLVCRLLLEKKKKNRSRRRSD